MASNPITVHVFLHSHMDEGWIYTYDHYYRGTGSDDGGCVKCIFNNVYHSLLKDPNRKYQIAETSFFKTWWLEQPDEVKSNFVNMLNKKQVEFMNGGWSANDEACTYYEDIVDNFVLGHRWLKNEFGVDPNIGWQIDSFGHSATHAALMAQAGYDAMFFGRIDFQEWENRRREKDLEFNWKPQNPHNESLLGRLLYVHYSDTKFLVPDNYYCRSIFCHGRLNVAQYKKLTEWLTKQSEAFKTKNIAMLVGDDFHLWRDAEKDFDGIEAMIAYFDQNPNLGIKVKFSTLSEYIEELNTDYQEISQKTALSTKHGDFFPYIEDSWTSWVGYFTSKSMFKLKVREMSQYYNAVKLLFAQFILKSVEVSEVNTALAGFEEILSVVQHHDGISGTMKEIVKKDYARWLDTQRDNVDKEVVNLLRVYTEKYLGEVPIYSSPIEFDWRQRNPLLVELFQGGKKVLVNVFNPGETDKFLIKIKVPTYKYKVLDDRNNFIIVDIICNDLEAKNDCYIYFVDEIPAFSLKNYILLPATLSKRIVPSSISKEQQLELGNRVKIQIHQDLRKFSYSLCPKIEEPLDIIDLFQERSCLEDTLDLNYEYYESYIGQGSQVSSGAYIFRPKNDSKIEFSPIQSGRVFRGKYLTIVQIQRKDMKTDLKFIHHQLERGIEIESYLEPVVYAPKGKEIVLVLRSEKVKNLNKEFYTDANGYYMQKRKVNSREGFTSMPAKEIMIPSNYYPITSGMYIEDSSSKLRMTVVTDRAQGATSLKTGEIEIMLHRITLQDDWKGLSEVLNEKDPEGGQLRVSTRHYLMYSAPEYDLKFNQRVQQYKLDRSLQYWFANTNKAFFENPRKEDSETVLNIESNIKLSIRSHEKNEFIVRLHNLDEEKSKIVKIYDLETKSLSFLNDFSGRNDLKLESITELSLFAHKNKDELRKNRFDPHQPDWKNKNDGQELTTVELIPMEIRTFKLVLDI